jgi:GNAT superfamily N-acetyltransferase
VDDLERWTADVVLSDGGTIHIRPIRSDDAGRLEGLHARLSQESRYLRFFSPMPNLPPSLVERFVNVDYMDRMALVATLGDDIVGVARYDTDPDDASQAEVAFTVDDAQQGRGLATVLLEHLAGVAADRGLRRFVAQTLPENDRMLHVFRAAGYGDERKFDGGVIQVTFSIEPTPTSIDAVRRRERLAAAAAVRRFLRPRSVAVIGAGRTPLGIGHELFRNLLRGDFVGPVYPVNREATYVASVRAYPDLASVPDDVDLAVIVVPAGEVDTVLDACGKKGVAGAVIVSEGFADAGPDGAEVERALVEKARSLGLRILGPNSMGVANADAGVRLNATLAQRLPPPGQVGFLAQSSALGVAILDEISRRGVGISSFVSAGNKADVSADRRLYALLASVR